MLEAIKRFLTKLAESEDKAPVGEEELRLAAAALMYHVVAIDGVVSEEERETLSDLLKRQFDLDPIQAGSLMEAAKTADAEAVDLYSFTRVLKGRLEAADRERIIEMMWRLVFADGTVHEFEDNVVWRVAELLGVSTQARIRLKQAVRSDAE